MNLEAALPKKTNLFYAGAWHTPNSGAYIDAINPATQESLSQFANANEVDVNAAIQAAHFAFQDWKDITPSERASLLRQAEKKILAHKDTIAMIDALDCGNPFTALKVDVDYMAEALRFYAGLVTEIKGDTVPLGKQYLDYTIREPLGVIACILPFNHPAMSIGQTIAPALAAGNTVVVKPSEQSSLSAVYIAELLSDIFPKGVFNVLTGDRSLGVLITNHKLICKVTFIGSVDTGRAIMQSAANSFKHLTLELGGKNALLAYPDADPRQVAQSAINGMNLAWCGQSCGSTSRIFLHEDIKKATIKHMLELIKQMQPGLPSKPETNMGCLISKDHFNRVQAYIQSGLDEGANLLYGGNKPTDTSLVNGHFLFPALFTGVKHNMRIAKEEIFGPVISVLDWVDEEEMLDQVNDVEYGLTAAIWTNNLSKAHQVATRVEAGFIWVNQSSSHFIGLQFGGYKSSGIGKLGIACIEAMLACTKIKNVNVLLETPT